MISLNSIAWILVTVAAYGLALLVYKACRKSPLCHPLIVSIVLMWLVLSVLSIQIEDYQQQVEWLAWMLGPATVALAIPLRNQLTNIKNTGWRLFPAIIVGGFFAPLLAVVVIAWQGVDFGIQLSMLTKSITTPLAIEVTKEIGGYPSLAAIIVIVTGMVCVLLSPIVFSLTKLGSERHQGLVLGTIGHAIGTAQGFLHSEKTGAFATTALCINGILTAILLPLLFIFL